MNKLKGFLRGLGVVALIVGSIALWIVLPWFVLVGLAVIVALWMAFTRTGQQAASVTWVGVSTLSQRLGASSVIVVGIAGVVGVLVALLSMGEGLQKTLKTSGDTETAIVLRDGASAEIGSGLSRADATVIGEAPGIQKDASGKPVLSAEVVVITALPKLGAGTEANVEVRGIGPQAWTLRPNFKVVEGRAFKPGLRELIVGQGARAQFGGLSLGATLNLNNQMWNVVGFFESGDAHESELIGDSETIMTTYRRNGYQSVTVRLTSPSAFDGFKAAIESDRRIKADAKTTLDYYTSQSEVLSRVIRVLGIVIASIMAVGAVFGALNTMYAAVATRAREIATLRAIGFRSPPVIVSVMLETMLLALLGGLIGAGIAWLIFDQYTVSTLGANFSQVVFKFNVSPELLGMGVKWALAIGFIGGLLPALRAASLPVTVALRES
jgi:putative ABC transport system permease protein